LRSAILWTLVGMLPPALGGFAQEPRIEPVPRDAAGPFAATMEGRIEGYECVHYLVPGRAGDRVVVDLAANHLANYFNIFAPGTEPGRDRALFIGSTDGTRYEGWWQDDGSYLIQVFLMRSAARRGEVATYTLEIVIEDDAGGSAPAAREPPWPDDYDATGELPCSAGEPSFQRRCPFRVKRAAGDATIWTLKPADATDLRLLRFRDDTFFADDDTELRWNRQGDNWWLGAGASEFYLIPDAVIYGG
jgi:hypothetical protein